MGLREILSSFSGIRKEKIKMEEPTREQNAENLSNFYEKVQPIDKVLKSELEPEGTGKGYVIATCTCGKARKYAVDDIKAEGLTVESLQFDCGVKNCKGIKGITDRIPA